MLTESDTVLFTGLTSIFEWNKSSSSIFLSSKSFVCARSNFDVVWINSASIYFGELLNSLINDSEKSMIHFSGVNISCDTFDDNSCNILLSASILASFLRLVTSLNVAT
jgi:hypothetical protein